MPHTGRDLVTEAGPCGESREGFNKGTNERLFIYAVSLAANARRAARYPDLTAQRGGPLSGHGNILIRLTGRDPPYSHNANDSTACTRKNALLGNEV